MVSTPSPPSPEETAAAQSGMNRDTAITQQMLNMTNQVGPNGTLTYEQTGEGKFIDSQGKEVITPTYTAYTKLSDEQQALKDQTDAASLNLGQIANTQSDFLKNYLDDPLDTSGVPDVKSEIGGAYSSGFSPEIGNGYSTSIRRDIGGSYSDTIGNGYQTDYAGADDFSADRQRVVDAIKARAAPDMEAQSRNLETQLIGRGLRPGTAAWDSEMDRLQRGVNDFNLAADLAGGQEQTRLVNMSRDAAGFTNNALTNRMQLENSAALTAADFDRTGQLASNDAALTAANYGANAQAATNAATLTQSNFENNARTQALQELYARRNQPINEIGALLSGAQVQSPQFVSTPNASVAGVDYTGLVNQKYQAELQSSQAQMGGLFGLLGAGVTAFSDRRLKKNIRLIGRMNNGLGVYQYHYIWDLPIQEKRVGVMADEVRRVNPEAVVVNENGFDMVDYSMIKEAA